MKKSLISGMLGLLAFGAAASVNPQVPTVQQQQDEAIVPTPQQKLKQHFDQVPTVPFPQYRTYEARPNLISKRNPKRKKRVQARW